MFKQIKLGAKYVFCLCVMLQAFCTPMHAMFSWFRRSTKSREGTAVPAAMLQQQQRQQEQQQKQRPQGETAGHDGAVRAPAPARVSRFAVANVDNGQGIGGGLDLNDECLSASDSESEGSGNNNTNVSGGGSSSLDETREQGVQFTSEHALYGAAAAAVAAGAYGMWNWWQGGDKATKKAAMDSEQRAQRRVQPLLLGPVSMNQINGFDLNDVRECSSLNREFLKSLKKASSQKLCRKLAREQGVKQSVQCNPFYYVAHLSGNTLIDVQKQQLQKAILYFANTCLDKVAMNDLVTKFYELMAELTPNQYTDHLFKACARFIKTGNVADFVNMPLSDEQDRLRTVFVEAATQ